MTTADVLIVGAGPAGLTAAADLCRAGFSVVIAERECEAGGIPRHTDHLGYGMSDLHRVMSGPAYARRLTDRTVALGANLLTSTTVLDLDGTSARLHSASGIEQLDASAVLLATGVRERPRAARLVPGDRPAGVLTTGALQQFAARHGQPVGRRAVIVGAEHVSFSAVLTLRHVGCEVAAMITPLSRHQTYAALRWATASRYRVPVRTNVDIARVIGRRRVEAVELTDGSTIACDTVVFTGDWIPDHELARRAGCEIGAAARAPLVSPGFHTTVAGMFAAGNLVHPAETADVCARDGRRVAAAIARFLGGEAWPAPPQPIAATPPIRWATYANGVVTLRIGAFTTSRIALTFADGTRVVSRRRRLVPNRAIHVQAGDSPLIAAALV